MCKISKDNESSLSKYIEQARKKVENGEDISGEMAVLLLGEVADRVRVIFEDFNKRLMMVEQQHGQITR